MSDTSTSRDIAFQSFELYQKKSRPKAEAGKGEVYMNSTKFQVFGLNWSGWHGKTADYYFDLIKNYA